VADDSTATVLLAGAANLLIAVAKGAAGVVSGSSAMLAEAAHSVGDTMNQVFLLAAIRKSNKPADEQHPFGYGKERYFWALLAAVGIFVLGAGFAAFEGVAALRGSGGGGDPLWSFVVLGASFVFEGTSWLRSVWQLRRDAARADKPMFDHLNNDADPALRAVFWEDLVALLGLVLAAGGLALVEVTGTRKWDGVASLAIAVLLVGVAWGLGRQNQQYLIGKAADSAVVEGIREQIVGTDGIDGVHELLTMRLSPDEVLVAARVDLTDDFTPAELEEAADRVEDRIRERYPEVRHVFLDPTPGDPDAPREAP